MTAIMRNTPEPPDKCPQVEIVRESDKEHHAHAMADEELCTFITTALAPAKRIIRDNLAYIAEARTRFAQPGRRVPVMGKPTWGKWIQQNLGISDRHVRRLLAEQRDSKKETNRRKQKQEPRVEVESAAIIIGNRGLEMARKLRDGDLDTAKKIASDMLEADLVCPDSLLPPPSPEQVNTIDKGDIRTLASLWWQVFEVLEQTERRKKLAQFFETLPSHHLKDVKAAIAFQQIEFGDWNRADGQETSHAEVREPVASVRVTKCPSAHESGSEGSCERNLPDATDYKPAAIVEAGWIRNEEGKLEYVGKSDAVA